LAIALRIGADRPRSSKVIKSSFKLALQNLYCKVLPTLDLSGKYE
jgi:hypothetical protein